MKEEETEKEDDNNQTPDVRYEADVIEGQRILDDEDHEDHEDDYDDDVDDEHRSKPARKKEDLGSVDPSAVSRDGWKVQNAYRLRRKIQRITIREVSKKDVMPNERVKLVSN